MKQLYTPKLPQNHKYKPIGDVYYNAMLSIWSRFIVLYVFMEKELVMAREECKRSADRRCEMEELLCKILKIFLAGQSHKACITSVTFQYVSSLKGDEKAIWLKVNRQNCRQGNRSLESSLQFTLRNSRVNCVLERSFQFKIFNSYLGPEIFRIIF